MSNSTLFMEVNEKQAIKSEVKTKLKEILELLTKERLNAIASNQDLTGRSKMKKQELIEALEPKILDFAGLRSALLIATNDELRFFRKMAKDSYAQLDELSPIMYRYLMEKGLLFTFIDEGRFYGVVPEEVQKAFRNLDKSFEKEHERIQRISRYMEAAANLYGICELNIILDIFNSHNNEKANEMELLEVYSHSSLREQLYYVWKGYLFSDYFNPSDEEWEELLKKTKDKPRYVPDPEEFLRYAGQFYYEVTPELHRLKAYILQNLCKDQELAGDLVDNIQLACSMEEPIGTIMDEFENFDIHFKTKAQVQAITSLIIDVYNNTRLWSNCGHTPVELRKMSAGSDQQRNSNVVYLGQRVSAKIGRNEACPCGSGKKYKRCCGK